MLFFSCVCIKYVKLAKKDTKNMKLKFIDKGRYFWVNRKDLEVESDVANWANSRFSINVIQKNPKIQT